MKYFDKTDSDSKFKQIISNIESLTTDEADKQFQAEIKSVKFATFGKV